MQSPLRHPRGVIVSLLLTLAFVLGLLPAAHAQTGAASITGLVTDASGAAAPGVTVTATNRATNVDYSGASNQAGNYTIASVPVGTYVVKAALSGFRTTATRPITLEAKQIARVDFKLEVGALEDTLEVTARAPVLQTETATVGEVLSASTVQSLPLNGRNANQLALLLPGAITPNPDSFTTARNSGGGGRPYINGNREQTNNFLIDGVDMNETVDNRIAYQPSPDALAEISVETNNYAADQQRDQVRGEPVPGQRVRVLPQQRLRREHLGQQPVQGSEGRAQAEHLRRHPGRADRQEQAVLLRGLPGHDPRPAGLPDGRGCPGRVAHRRSVEHQHRRP